MFHNRLLNVRKMTTNRTGMEQSWPVYNLHIPNKGRSGGTRPSSNHRVALNPEARAVTLLRLGIC